jgi:thioredoxin-like negative regulator of GroEL
MRNISYQEWTNLFSEDWHLTMVGASWCNPCKNLRAVLIEKESSLPVTLMYSDVDENSEFVLTFDIKTVPFLLLSKRGKILVYSGDSSIDKVLEWVYNRMEENE